MRQDPRQFTTSIGVRYEDLPKVKAITADIKSFLDQHPGVDKKLPYGSGLGSLQDWSVQIGVMVSTTSYLHIFHPKIRGFNTVLLLRQ